MRHENMHIPRPSLKGKVVPVMLNHAGLHLPDTLLADACAELVCLVPAISCFCNWLGTATSVPATHSGASMWGSAQGWPKGLYIALS